MTLPAPVVVIGGGPAGAACARELARAGHTVRLLTAGHGAGPAQGETVGPALVRLLWNAGLTLPPSCGTPLTSFGVSWEDSEWDDTAGHPWDVTTGLALDRPAFDRWLQEEAARAGATIDDAVRVTRVEPDGDGWRVFAIGNGEPLCLPARFVIEATGRGSRSVCHSQIKRFYTDELMGASAVVTAPHTDTAEAIVEAVEDGWWFSLRVPGVMPFVCFFTDADQMPESDKRLPWLAAQLNKTRHLRERVGVIATDVKARTWDARSSIRSVLWRDRWLAIGDAAWAMDPLSGTGVERAIRYGIDAGRAVAGALERGTNESLRELAIAQVSAFREAISMQSRVYSGVTRFRSRFWDCRREEQSLETAEPGRGLLG